MWHALYVFIIGLLKRYVVSLGQLIKLYRMLKHFFFKCHHVHRYLSSIPRTFPYHPLRPVITCWGTWLNSRIYYCEYYEQVCEIA